MLDPLTALAIANSVIQIVDFGGRLFARTIETVRTNGNIEENVDLELMISDLRVITQSLENASQSKPRSVGNTRPEQLSADERLCLLAQRCQDISTGLLKILEDIKSKGDGRYRTWNAVRQSLHTIMKKGDIGDYLRRLELLRGELVLNLVDTIRCVRKIQGTNFACVLKYELSL